LLKNSNEFDKFKGFFNFSYDESKDKIFLEVDKLDYEFLYIGSLASGVGSNDIGLDRGQLGQEKLVKFVKKGNKILLVEPNLFYRAQTQNISEKKSVEQAFAKSVISSDMKIKGKISADGDLVLLGSVVGDIKCHSLSVEDTGTLKGNIDADVVTVSGKCDGQVSGDIISIKSTGKITGEVFYENISIEEGAVVEAQVGKRKNKIK